MNSDPANKTNSIKRKYSPPPDETTENKGVLTPYNVAVTLILAAVAAASIFLLTIPAEVDYGSGSIRNEITKYTKYKENRNRDRVAGIHDSSRMPPKCSMSIYSTFAFKDKDWEATENKTKRAMARVPFYFEPDKDALKEINTFFKIFKKFVFENNPEKKDNPNHSDTLNSIAETAFNAVKNLSPDAITRIREAFDDATVDEMNEIQALLERGTAPAAASFPPNSVFRDSLGRERLCSTLTKNESMAKSLADLLFDTKKTDAPALNEDRASMTNIIRQLLEKGTVKEALSIRERKIKEAQANVTPIEKLYSARTILIAKGNELNDSNTQLLERYLAETGLQNKSITTSFTLTVNAALCIVILVFISIYVYHLHPETARSLRSLALTGGVVIAGLLLNRFLGNLFYSLTRTESIMPQLIAYSLPLAFCSLILSVIFGLRVALCAGLYVSAITAIALNNSFPVFMLGLVTSCIAGFAVRKTTDYKKFFGYGVIACCLSTFVVGGIFISKVSIMEPEQRIEAAAEKIKENPPDTGKEDSIQQNSTCKNNVAAILAALAFAGGITITLTAVFATREKNDSRKILVCGTGILCLAILAAAAVFVNNGHIPGTSYGNAASQSEVALSAAESVEEELEFDSKIAIQLSTVAFFGGILTVILALLGIFIIETFLHVSTNMTFLLYTDRNHEILKDLRLKAPATSLHCETVASLAEKAAMDIKANPLKAQACGLFHDIGKLYKPDIFTENTNGADVSELYPPETFASMIKAHVSEGVARAKEKKLTLPLINAIQRHHGTDFISFLHEKAKAVNPDVDEKLFRYDGPLPSEKEIVIVSLADCCEAAVRSIKNPTEENIRAKVTDIFEKKLRAGQLAEADITLKEFYIIRDSFVNTLSTMNHTRVAYINNKDSESKS